MNQGEADDWEASGRSVQYGGTSGGTEGLKGDSGDKAEELDGLDSEGERKRLGGIHPHKLHQHALDDGCCCTHTSTISALDLGSAMKIASGGRSGSVVMANSGSESAVGSGILAEGMADTWLGSGSGVELAVSSSTCQESDPHPQESDPPAPAGGV